ncbi:AAA family ATPase [Archangium violaceum]|uniref:serine/threonine-protein kinase n=1 Tax=Archangium violaceum TaxID=83451 RepID=UPI0019521999|nr:serine/threonine-protein kinase [Archangium violaceum]QRO00447.1 AAA family ATPase [Archangium violaceum]
MDNDITDPSPSGTPGLPLSRGKSVAGRFIIEDLAGRGGMGFVYRARDCLSDRPVALKFLHVIDSPEVAYRFNREAVLLSELCHPGIVSYVAHGTTEAGQRFLAMEWLEGEDLAQRLSRQSLGLSEALALLRRAAEALVTAHQQGIVHRDLKPSNLFLRGGRPEDVVLLDFGIARTRSLLAVTRPGIVVGTPGYMSPEQASSQPDTPPSADIFSLGCVLYECLTGQPPFAAPHFAAALAKILFTEPAPLHTLRADLPPGVQVLVDRMLAKDPRRRLLDASTLLEALSALESVPELLLPRGMEDSRPPSLAGAEQQLVSVLLVSLLGVQPDEQGPVERAWASSLDALRVALAPLGARVELLADGSLVATLVPERGSATDQAALAARCALTFKERWPEAAVVLVTGLGVINEHLPVGDAMDGAGRLLRQLERMPASSCVVLDEVTAGLLGPGFQLSRSSAGTFLLQGEQLSADASRPLLGKPTPCVGREQELARLDFTLDSCIEAPAARALLVTAPAGVGKSRLRHEFLRRIERQEQRVLVLLGRGDPMSAGASYGLLGQALRRLCGIVEGENLEARRTRLYQRVARHLPEDEAQDVVESLGELCAIPFPGEASPRLRAARGDPRLMSAQVSRALVSFLGAECTHQPVLLVLEDLHWSDALTIKLVDEVLRELAGRPLMVLALARPEVKELFPGLWSPSLQELPLQGLSRKASARLAREVLGSRVSDTVVRRVVEQSDGNALFLEELIRVAAEGRGEAAPETVLAVLQSRLTRMESGARQVLLAASFFGRTFWAQGVGELLGRQDATDMLAQHLRQLVAQEVIEPQPDSRFPGTVEYRFRHALVRDAAYGLVPDRHRLTGHGLAGAWLERMGETDPVVLATHYQLGQQLELAAHFYTRAAEQLFERNALQGCLQCVESALACGVGGEAQSRLRALQAVVAIWLEQIQRALELGMPVVSELKAGSRLWCRLMGGLILGTGQDGQQERAVRLRELLLRTSPEPEALAAYIESVALLGLTMAWSGSRQGMEQLLGRIIEVGADIVSDDPVARGWMRFMQGYFLHLIEARPWQAFLVAELGMRDFREIGSERNASALETLSGMALDALGALPGALERLRDAVAISLRTDQRLVGAHARHHLIQALAGSADPEHQREARELVREWMGNGDFLSFKQGTAHAMLAKVVAASGELHEAEVYARRACELLEPFLSYLVYARTVLSNVLLAQGRATEARQVADLGVQDVARMGSWGVYAVAMHLALTEACFAEGDECTGEMALREAYECVRARADDIPDPAARERFLRQVPENARTLALVRQRWGEATA